MSIEGRRGEVSLYNWPYRLTLPISPFSQDEIIIIANTSSADGWKWEGKLEELAKIVETHLCKEKLKKELT